MKKYALHTEHKKILADTLTPVSAYLKLRDQFPHSLLLESSDYHANNNDFSYLCCNPIASIELKDNVLTAQYPDGKRTEETVDAEADIPEKIHQFSRLFESKPFPFKFITNGLFGYIAHEAVERFDQLDFNRQKEGQDIPDLFYAVYQNIIAISLFNHEAHLFSHSLDNQHNLEELEQVLNGKTSAAFGFKKKGENARI